MAGIREHKKAVTRKAIIDSAVILFTDKGFDKTSIEDIARLAGIGKATVYTYFPTKDDIFLTFCDDELVEVFADFSNSPLDGVSLLDQLIDFFMIKFRFVTKNHEFGRQLIREMAFPKNINQKVIEHDRRYFDILERIFKAAQERGEIGTDHDIFSLSGHFYCLYLGMLSGWYGGYISDLEETEEGMRTLFTQAFHGIAR